MQDCAGSSPVIRTKKKGTTKVVPFFLVLWAFPEAQRPRPGFAPAAALPSDTAGLLGSLTNFPSPGNCPFQGSSGPVFSLGGSGSQAAFLFSCAVPKQIAWAPRNPRCPLSTMAFQEPLSLRSPNTPQKPGASFRALLPTVRIWNASQSRGAYLFKKIPILRDRDFFITPRLLVVCIYVPCSASLAGVS